MLFREEQPSQRYRWQSGGSNYEPKYDSVVRSVSTKSCERNYRFSSSLRVLSMDVCLHCGDQTQCSSLVKVDEVGTSRRGMAGRSTEKYTAAGTANHEFRPRDSGRSAGPLSPRRSSTRRRGSGRSPSPVSSRQEVLILRLTHTS
jgi:hypothetical protein